MDRKRVLIPAAATSPGSIAALESAGLDVVLAVTDPEELDLLANRSTRDDVLRIVERSFDEHLATASAVQALGGGVHIPFTAEVMDRAPELEVIFIGAAGYDAIDVDAATERGIVVVNAPGGNAVGVAEHAFALMIDLSHKLSAADRIAHAEHREVSRPVLKATHPPLSVLEGKTLGLLGFGNIGRKLASRALAFDMTVVIYDPYLSAASAAEAGVTVLDSMDSVLATSDFVSMHTPLTAETANLVSDREFGIMKNSAFIINTSRGETLDTEALVRALESGAIAGAGLDVSNPEPLPDNHRLFDFDNVVLTPHTGGASPEMLEAARVLAATAAAAVLTGGTHRAIVNPAALENRKARL